MRIGLFGGTFDPVHMGHLILAEQSRDQGRLDEVWFVPSAHPPHKREQPLTRFEQRCDMLELATAGHPHFRIERIEKELPPPGYTVQTLTHLRQRHPDHEFFLILGADSLADLPGWYQPQQIVSQAGLLVAPRPGVMLWTAERLAEAIAVNAGQVRLHYIACPLIEIASRELRRSVAQGWSIRYLVPRAVEEYIRERGLYRPKASGSGPASATYELTLL
ncbi:MAG: nicotinate (nicotinamide) nucleotide adenylyltransferase [Thermogemmata sp.]|jgi:nicotinate-nucleotide adenylyltransferase|uniref:Probable nicotinate-nucleotide adenylyltransferase n=1 Tax=Thermogemmata fonticola TaxID=2755323 RepID=A0A7V8VG87_9BACT|nr:nicotinate (nicotinamide) nucleotide adenylyltransferase [Thermogemmata fonticola]MBA2227480.1 nicotinate (nicotinamide) nucleotide adenylyltransferase [Thermogemmata fonticola]MCX8138939.1 nicotinate (nicotinamide) nucleotide adenylyltransferase [Gemmataceae bacterium]